jgi:hypothetical protein
MSSPQQQPSPSRQTTQPKSDAVLAFEKIHDNDVLESLSKLDLEGLKALQRTHDARDQTHNGLAHKQAQLIE